MHDAELASQTSARLKAKIDSWWLAVVGLFLALGTTYTWLGLWRYRIFRAGVDDGIFTQVANSVFHGFSSTIGENANHLLIHWSPILIVTAPFVKLFGGTPGLIGLQAFACAAVVFPVFAFATTRFSKLVAFALTLVAACYPPLSGVAVGDFHELAFVPAVAAGLVLALDRRAWRWAIIASVTLACVKEDQFVALAFIGGLVALSSRADRERRLCGVSIAGIGVFSAILYFGVIRPLIDPHFPYWSFHFYQWWWYPSTPLGFASWNSPLRVQYLIAALSPLGFLPLLSRRYFVFTLPGLAEVMLSHEAITLFIGTHYSATWIGYMLCAFVDGVAWLASRSMVLAKLGLVAAMGVSIWTSEYYSPVSPGYFLGRKITPDDALREQALSSLPTDANIGSGDEFFAHLGLHPNAMLDRSNQDFLVYDSIEDNALWRSPKVQGLVAQGTYKVALRRGSMVILRRNKPR
ncbi:MAG TPA: DUF2079 domain-containing protein [Candidatus Cybelea sp.]|jgi:uncharacterized membrane protein